MAASDFSTQAVLYLNDIYQQVYIGGSALMPGMQEDWWWLYATDTILLQPAYATGTIALTNGSTSGTLSTASSTDLTGYWIMASGYADPFQISSHVAGSASITLDVAWQGDDEVAASYNAYKVDYDLPSDTLRLLSPMTIYRGSYPNIEGLSARELATRFPLSQTDSGPPRYFSMIDSNTVRFSHYGNLAGGEVMRIDVPYLARPSTLTGVSGEDMPMPLEYRTILSDFVTYRILLDKNDSRADAYGASARGRLQAMQRENRRRWKNMRVSVATIPYRPTQASAKLQTAGGLYFYPK